MVGDSSLLSAKQNATYFKVEDGSSTSENQELGSVHPIANLPIVTIPLDLKDSFQFAVILDESQTRKLPLIRIAILERFFDPKGPKPEEVKSGFRILSFLSESMNFQLDGQCDHTPDRKERFPIGSGSPEPTNPPTYRIAAFVGEPISLSLESEQEGKEDQDKATGMRIEKFPISSGTPEPTNPPTGP